VTPVVVRLGRCRPKPGRLGSTLDQAGDVGTLDVSAQEVDYGTLTLHHATLTKRASRLVGSAIVTESDLRTALPILSSVTPVASGDGTLTLRGTAMLFGLSVTVDATVSAQDGKLVVVPDVPLGALATVTVFSDPHIQVQSVSATAVPGGFAVRGTAAVR
jgi:hypothetical protein